MLTRLWIRNFKLFDEAEIELEQRVLFVGPNNYGKSSALQALTLWHLGVRRWVEKRGSGKIPEKRPGVTINRRDLVSVPVPEANHLWRALRVRAGKTGNGKPGTENVLIEIEVDGTGPEGQWRCGLEFDYANEESFYCRPRRTADGGRMEVPKQAADVKVAYLPPMSGLAAQEDRLDPGSIQRRLGEGRTAEVLRNLCYAVFTSDASGEAWERLCDRMRAMFGVRLDGPRYLQESGQVVITYRDHQGTRLDLSASGRGQQQTLLLLTYMALNPGAVLLLDEPDAHLEVIRQRQIYQVLSEAASESNSQVIVASHSEVLLEEAAQKDAVVAFLGRPHRIDNRPAQVMKSLREIGFDQYYLAEQNGWVLYLEGPTDLAILKGFAEVLNHPAKDALEQPFVHYVANQPRKAQEHFHGLREARPDLAGVAIYDRLDRDLPPDAFLQQIQWKRCEIENYLCIRDVLLDYAAKQAERAAGDLFRDAWRDKMAEAIEELEEALESLDKPDPWGGELKVSDEFLGPLFRKFAQKTGYPLSSSKSEFCELVRHMRPEQVAPEVRDVLDRIVDTAKKARPGG
jgi:hypothetical protein